MRTAPVYIKQNKYTKSADTAKAQTRQAYSFDYLSPGTALFKIIAVRPGFGYVTVLAGRKARLSFKQPRKIVGAFKANAVGDDLHRVVLSLKHFFRTVYTQIIDKFYRRVPRLFFKIAYKIVWVQMEYAAKLAYCYILAQILLYICKYAAQLSVLKDILARYAGIFGIIGQQLQYISHAPENLVQG